MCPECELVECYLWCPRQVSTLLLVVYVQVLAYMKRKSVEAEKERQKRVEREKGKFFRDIYSHYTVVDL